ncbi:hypothetical protein HQ47_10750 [Porphyromonas macacae]|uniref:Uncharacterized protein n=1 Tax=Porphyromonas macacae TaxID=28115 RepID=A0A0A2E0I8_9PORP|nr:hypothetical protein HQ47_10750 [Porphyromonas macacae]
MVEEKSLPLILDGSVMKKIVIFRKTRTDRVPKYRRSKSLYCIRLQDFDNVRCFGLIFYCFFTEKQECCVKTVND